MKKYFPASEWRTAKAVLAPESGGNPRAVGGPNTNGTFDYGCFQINKGFQIYGDAIYDPDFNAKIAYTTKFIPSYWRPWSVYNNGKYLNYLES